MIILNNKCDGNTIQFVWCCVYLYFNGFRIKIRTINISLNVVHIHTRIVPGYYRKVMDNWWLDFSSRTRCHLAIFVTRCTGRDHFWQLPVQSLTTISTKCRHFLFSVWSFHCKTPLVMMNVAVRERKTAVHGRIQVINGAQVALECWNFKWHRIACSISNKGVWKWWCWLYSMIYFETWRQGAFIY